MINKIRAYLDHAFRDVPDTKKSQELKDELLANLIEKYNDQLLSGKSEQEAYNAAIAGIGDISEMIDSIASPAASGMGIYESPQKTQKRAAMKAIAIACFILSPAPVIYTSVNGDPITGLCLLFVLVAIGVALLVFSSMTAPRYAKVDESVVEEFKEWRSGKHYKNSVYRSFMSGYWTLVTAIYLIISFMTFAWHVTWIIFIIAAALSHILRGVMALRGEENE